MLRHVARTAVALRTLAGSSPAVRAARLPAAQRQPQWLLSVGARALSTTGINSDALPNGLVVAGVSLPELARRSRRDMQDDFGDAKVRKVRQALPQRWKSLVDAGKVAPQVVSQVFLAAVKFQLPKLMLEAFEYSDEHYPERVDFVMYGEMFNMLSRSGKPDAILNIYERVKDRFDDERPAPEIIYRFGIYAKLGQEDFKGVEQLVQDMGRHGIAVSNEIASRVMAGLAKAGNEHAVLEIFESLDPQVGRWHPADVDRVITSLGQVGHADEAFEFYRESQIKLSGNTLLSLLRVCELNDRPRHAMAVLANRKRFKLALNTRQFNRILESIEFFDKREDIADVLQEMVDSRVPLDAATHAIIAHNQDALQGTKFAVSAAADGWEKRSRQLDEPLVKDLMTKRAFGDVAAIVDAYARPVSPSDMSEEDTDSTLRFTKHNQASTFPIKGATTVPAWLAVPAVSAYSSIGEHHKLVGLLRGFALVKSASVERALALAAKLAAPSSDSRDPVLLYNALKALQFQGHDISRARDAIECFRGFNDIDAAIRLCQQTSRQFVDALARNDGDAKAANRAVGFDRVYILNAALQMLVESHELSAVVDLLNEVEFLGLNVSARDYAAVFSAMRTHNQSLRERGNDGVVYDAADFEMIWRDMAHRGVAPTTRILSQICSAVRASGGANMQRSVLGAYQQLASTQNGDESGSEDNYVMPLPCYTALLEMAARHASVEDVRQLYKDAVSHMDEAAAVMRAKRSLRRSAQRDWVTICVSKMAADGNVDEAHALLLSMPTECDAPPTYGGIMAVLKASAAKDGISEKTAELLRLLREQHQQQRFAVKLKDVEGVASAAIARGDVRLAHGVLELMAANVKTDKMVEAATDDASTESDDSQEPSPSSDAPTDAHRGRTQGAALLRRVERRLLDLYVQLLASLDRSEVDADLLESVDARVRDLTARVQHHEQQE